MLYENASDVILDDIFLGLTGFIPGVELALKLEGLNPAGSIKLKTAVALVEAAENSGALAPGGHVIESSSGNLGIALSSVCASRGYAFTCVVDPNTSQQSKALMRALGAEVVVVGERDECGGFLQSRIDYIAARLREHPSLVWPNQYANQANPQAHHDTTAPSIIKQFPTVDHLFVGAGTTGTLMGVVRYFRQYSPHTRIVAVDTEGSITFGFPPGPRRIPGLGTSRRPEIFRPGQADETVLVPEADAIRMCRRLAAERGLLLGGSTGAVLSGVQRLRADIPSGSRVVAISPDNGDRYLQTVYSDAWVLDHYSPAALETAG